MSVHSSWLSTYRFLSFAFCLCSIGTVAKENLKDRAGSSMSLSYPLFVRHFL
jgi:hypothetical protein